MVSAAVIDVPGLIDEHPIGRFQIQALVLCFAVLFGDGYDALVIGDVGPSLAQALHIVRPAPAESSASASWEQCSELSSLAH
jgi:hypothetical protein